MPLFPHDYLRKDLWILITIGYCFLAAVLRGFLLQPRDFLSAGFLYAILILGALGILSVKSRFSCLHLLAGSQKN